MRRRDFLRTTATGAAASLMLGGKAPAISSPDTRPPVEPAAGRLTGWRADVDQLVRKDWARGRKPSAFGIPVGFMPYSVRFKLTGAVNRDGFGVVEPGCLMFRRFCAGCWLHADGRKQEWSLVVFEYRSQPWNRSLAGDGRVYDLTDNTGTYRLYPVADFSLIPDVPLTHGV